MKDLERELTYAELYDEAGDVARSFRREGVVAGDRVGLLLGNSVDFVVAAFASMLAGAIFVPLAVTSPAGYLATIVADCGPALVITGPSVDGAPSRPVPVLGARSVTFEHLRGAGPRSGRARSTQSALESGVVYAIYTSGTTGTPKGVLVGSKAFAAAVGSAIDALGLDEATRALCVSPFHFDGSFGTLFPTLVAGGTAVIRPREALLFVRPFFDALVREQVTFTGFSPSYLRLLLGSKRIGELSGTSLETVAIGGEASSAADVRALLSAAPSLRVFNRYGPTESTIAVTHARLTLESIEDGVVPIGSPHPGVSFHLLGDGGKPVEDVGEVGELYVGGVQLMEGYWAAPELSSEVLRTDVVPGRTVYRTGDLAYRDATRGYVYVGRCDRVVKRSGVRISLVEIGDAIQDLAGASSSTCALFDDEGSPGIVVFLVVGHPVLTDDLRERARDLLPEPMVPDRIEVVDGFPLTHTGKLDERSLLDGVGLRPPRRADGPRLPGR